MQSLAATAELFALFAEPTRVRLLRLLAEHELSVVELVAVTDVPQSSVSTHLGKLRDADLVRDRKNGTSTYYALAAELPAGARAVWDLVSKNVSDAVLTEDRERVRDVMRARLLASRGNFPEPFAGEMERHYSPGRTWESLAASFVGFLRLGRVLDIGAGDGAVAEMIAPRAKSITCIDASEKMIAAAKKRLGKIDHVRVARGDMHALDFKDASFDQVLMLNVLVHSKEPAKAIGEASRVLARGGDLVVVSVDAHDHEDAARAWGHAQNGIAPSVLRRHLTRGGLEVTHCETVCHEKRAPRFGVVVAYAEKKK